MTPRQAAIVIACTAALAAAAGSATADGGRTAWPSTAALAGAWGGTAASTAVADFTFPVSAVIAVSATGRPTGLARLGDPVNCSGRWSPVSTSGATTVFAEMIINDTGDRCITGGTVRLSAASGGRLRYVWTKGDAGSVAYLEPRGLSGHWTGSIRQRGLGTIPAHIRVVGVRRGQMAGATHYAAPLACGGTLTPIGAGSQRRAVFDEEITHSAAAACVGSGTTTLTLRPDGRMGYRWTGGGEVSTGVLTREG